MEQHLKEKDRLKLTVKKLGINGEGIGYDQKLAIFVDQVLPYEEIEVEIEQVFENRAIASLVEIIKESPDRKTAFCPVYDLCGGCQTQHYDYEKGLEQKRDILVQSFDRYIKQKVKSNLVRPTMGADNPKNYRNKASLPIQKIKGKNHLGMYARNSNQFIPIEDCPIQNEEINRILKSIVSLMDELAIDGFDHKVKKGYIRNVVVRVAEHTKQAQVSFIMLKESKRVDELARRLMEIEPTVISVFEVMNGDLKKPGFFTDEIRLIQGVETITEVLNDHEYMLKPEAFFQLNTAQAHKFYLEMKRMANLKKHEIAIDAYAGIAPVSHYIHMDAKHVYAVEIDPHACESAKLSLAKNGIQNVSILQSDFKRALSGLSEKKIDVMFFDPPRVGLGDDTIKQILKFKPSRLVYGSCNPSTLAKDLNLLLEKYQLVETVPIDMFPYTSLVESVSLLVLK